MRLYLDACCLNRPFDAPTQERVRDEAEAGERVLERVSRGEDQWVASAALEMELQDCRDRVRRKAMRILLELAEEIRLVDEAVLSRAEAIAVTGIAGIDAIHLSAAIEAGCGVFLTTDDRLLRRAKRAGSRLPIGVMNPIEWLREVSPG